MTKGIEVTWRDGDGDGNVFEIEYFYGIDVDRLDCIPEFSSVAAYWPRYRRGTAIHYNVRAHHIPEGSGDVRLVVEYCEEENRHLADYNHGWGTNHIVLTPGGREGHCDWRGHDIPWRAFDVAANNDRPRATYLRSRRYEQFRDIILGHDGHTCVLTGEPTMRALEAAHLIPAKQGENDQPANGIALRADLHRLFDAGLFTLAPDGKVLLADPPQDLSEDYVRLLRDACLPPETLERVHSTLALSQFRERKHARR